MFSVAAGSAQTPRPTVKYTGPTPEDAGPGGGGPEGPICGTPDLTEAEAQALADQTGAWLSSHPDYATTTAIITIPVAMHVVRSDAGAWDVTDTQIANQIAALNATYAITNFRFSPARR